jgi:hypothetical protein
MVGGHAALGFFLAVLLVWAASLGMYWGTARARLPLRAPQSQEITDKLIAFKREHLGTARTGFIAASLLLVAALVVLIVSSV